MKNIFFMIISLFESINLILFFLFVLNSIAKQMIEMFLLSQSHNLDEINKWSKKRKNYEWLACIDAFDFRDIINVKKTLLTLMLALQLIII